jgi:hypothetical protein
MVNYSTNTRFRFVADTGRGLVISGSAFRGVSLRSGTPACLWATLEVSLIITTTLQHSSLHTTSLERMILKRKSELKYYV